jgi:prepilin-type N-terminal cleavage/methylation domain-containing protein/prepilin-type processing-associated H-X9-DG protein
MDPMRTSSRPSRDAARPGFTLVELLVVIGIIALLISILLPALGRAREQARQVVCMGKLRQLGVAFDSYIAENKGRFPFHADVTGIHKEDWIHWQLTRKISQSAIAKYIGSVDPDVFRCPSDDPNNRPRVLTEPYHYSFTLNWKMASNGGNVRFGDIKGPDQKIMLVEESESSLDDGNWHPELVKQPNENFLAVRHGRPPPQDGVGFDDDRRGNAAFADGHGAYITREDSRNPLFYDPTK